MGQEQKKGGKREKKWQEEAKQQKKSGAFDRWAIPQKRLMTIQIESPFNVFRFDANKIIISTIYE
ncbi:MAG: hypothetical protein ACFFDW_06805 [Candidatus Thorarchaeota archaeon]